MYRSTLITQLQTDLAVGNISVSTELPYTAGSDSLNIKNMKTVYVDADNTEITPNQMFLSGSAVDQTETTINAYLSVDAKNPPADLDTRIASIQNAKQSVANVFVRECETTSDIDSDIITYTFEYKFTTI
tara:strand:- start:591 stop:980 length:390 start_codon:yes stop_codon:yes gene_type:complete